MPYLIQGTAQQLAELFGQGWLTKESSDDGTTSVEKDLDRIPFLGTEAQAKHHLATWRASTAKKTYCQGNMYAGNAHLFLGIPFLFKQEDEDEMIYQNNCVRPSFAFVHEEQELCGLLVFARKDKPSQWLIGLSMNNQSSPDKRRIALVTNFDLTPLIKAPNQDLTVTVVDRLANPLLDQVTLPIKRLLEHALQAENGDINPRIKRINQLVRFLGLDRPSGLLVSPIKIEDIEPKLLLAENPALDLVLKYNLRLSPPMLMDCLAEQSGLRKEIEDLVLTSDEAINKCLIQMIIYFYEEKILAENRAFLQEQLFKKTTAIRLWNEDQLKLVPFLVKKKYSTDVFQLILSKEAYYSAVTVLVQLGFTQDVPVLFEIPDKLKELEFLELIPKENTKALCLIFWVKGQLKQDEYQRIIEATKLYPLMADTLIALDKTGTVSINQLKALALNPQKHIQKSILYHFSDQLKLNESVLNALDIEELNCLIHAFTVLKSNAGTKADMYDLAVKKNEQGQLLRLFLPHLAGIADPVYTKVLIDLLYLGIKRGPVSQGKAIASIKDKEFQELKDKELQELKLKELQGLAIDLHERFVCSKTIQTLGFKSDIISLAAKPKDDSASKFRQIILRVEDQCKQIYARLQSSSPDKQKAHAWQNTEKEYRKTLYTIASKAISDPDYDFRSQLDLEQTKILKIVDPEIKSLVETVLVVIANIFISVLTLGIANEIKYRKTGNYWFFNHSASGEELRALDKELTGIISPPTK